MLGCNKEVAAYYSLHKLTPRRLECCVAGTHVPRHSTVAATIRSSQQLFSKCRSLYRVGAITLQVHINRLLNMFIYNNYDLLNRIANDVKQVGSN